MIISGPVAVDSQSRTFGASVIDLATRGFVEEEYFFAGTAPRYRATGAFGPDGVWPAERIAGDPFVTRAIVRRPVDPARFNGTVVVEWNNVSAGMEIFEQGDTPAILDEGFAYVGVSAQYVGVHGFREDPHGLQAWSPTRYGGLDIHDDGLSYGIFNEIGRCFTRAREATGIDPLAGLTVQQTIAVGGSQSAARLVTYLNAIHPLEQVFDAFMPFTWFGSGTSIDDREVTESVTERLSALMLHPTRIRSDLDEPVLVVNSECETLSCVPSRQADTDRFRYWEVAGSPHGPRLHMELIAQKLTRDGLTLPVPPDPEVFGPVPWGPVFDAGLTHVQAWITGGEPPPSQPLIEVAGDPARISRDDDGNALGGVRLPEQDVSLTHNVGDLAESGAMSLMGLCTPLAPDVVLARYPDRAAYLSAFRSAADRAVAAGVLRVTDAEAAVARAQTRRFP